MDASMFTREFNAVLERSNFMRIHMGSALAFAPVAAALLESALEVQLESLRVQGAVMADPDDLVRAIFLDWDDRAAWGTHISTAEADALAHGDPDMFDSYPRTFLLLGLP